MIHNPVQKVSVQLQSSLYVVPPPPSENPCMSVETDAVRGVSSLGMFQ